VLVQVAHVLVRLGVAEPAAVLEGKLELFRVDLVPVDVRLFSVLLL
jgi:hypothetical protein